MNRVFFLGIVVSLPQERALPDGTLDTAVRLRAWIDVETPAGRREAQCTITVSLNPAVAARLESPITEGIWLYVEGSVRSRRVVDGQGRTKRFSEVVAVAVCAPESADPPIGGTRRDALPPPETAVGQPQQLGAGAAVDLPNRITIGLDG